MKISVKVKPHARIDKVIVEDGTYIVKVKEAAREGKANDAVITLLAAYLHVPRSAVTIKSGLTGRNKVIEITDR